LTRYIEFWHGLLLEGHYYFEKLLFTSAMVNFPPDSYESTVPITVWL